LRSTAELSDLLPCRARGSSCKKSHAEVLQGIPVLWSTHWCPARHSKGSCPQGPSACRHVATLGSLSGSSMWREKRLWASPGRRDLPVGPGARSCSHAQGRVDGSPALGSGRNFPPGHTGTAPWRFSAFLCSTEQQHSPVLLQSLWPTFLPAASAPPRWPLVPCRCGEEGFLPPVWVSKALWGFLAFHHSTEHGPLPGLLSALSPCSMPAALAPPLVPWLCWALLSIAGQEAQRSNAWRAKSRLGIEKWKTLEKTTHLLLLLLLACVGWGLLLILQILAREETGTVRPLFQQQTAALHLVLSQVGAEEETALCIPLI